MNTVEPILLTPGPLTTSRRTRQAMMVDWGSWDERFNQLTASLCEQLLGIINGATSHHCVPQGSPRPHAGEKAQRPQVAPAGKVQ
ncbi:2-aminoethylphosphonate--pyruvate transaminase, partial [Pseudomonas sp. Dout3]|nr:2-aminoethylphosphonate--pyruvate transaminase [Pseudomonas sp. Dout3]